MIHSNTTQGLLRAHIINSKWGKNYKSVKITTAKWGLWLGKDVGPEWLIANSNYDISAAWNIRWIACISKLLERAVTKRCETWRWQSVTLGWQILGKQLPPAVPTAACHLHLYSCSRSRTTSTFPVDCRQRTSARVGNDCRLASSKVHVERASMSCKQPLSVRESFPQRFPLSRNHRRWKEIMKQDIQKSAVHEVKYRKSPSPEWFCKRCKNETKIFSLFWLSILINRGYSDFSELQYDFTIYIIWFSTHLSVSSRKAISWAFFRETVGHYESKGDPTCPPLATTQVTWTPN